RPRIRPPEDEEPAYRGSSADEAPKPAALHPPETYTSAGFYPHGLAVEMDEADHWAIANLKIPQLPPVEFDHPVKGPVEVIDVETTDKLLEVCKGVNIPKGMIIIGCASRTPYLCRIYLGPIPKWSGVSRNLNLRHETGHCNGWGKDHAGIR